MSSMTEDEDKKNRVELNKLVQKIHALQTDKLRIFRRQEEQILQLNRIDLELEHLREKGRELAGRIGIQWRDTKRPTY